MPEAKPQHRSPHAVAAGDAFTALFCVNAVVKDWGKGSRCDSETRAVRGYSFIRRL